ncbi:MAG: 16S rRNA (cytidine(1402)-2'-O)-methyltransferase, partial [Campylobacteraceae bacterium]|nr:16S rRNA (cytidine(1402)-2'-O)-methyltransferase [Campylobacteraceae bacterium]
MLYFIPTPIGNLEDISIRSLKLLLSTPTLFCEDTRVTKKLIMLISEKFGEQPTTEQRFISLHSHNEKDVIKSLNANDFLSSNTAYVSDAGMPCISDPGALLVRFAQQNNIPYEVLPGANALLLSLASSGFEGSKFYFHGFLPHKKEAREKELKEILSFPYSVVLYESTHRILKFARELSLFAPEKEMFFIKEASKRYETHYFGSAEKIYEELKSANLNGEWAIVIKGNDNEMNGERLNVDDIFPLEISNKSKAKLLSKLTG